MLTIELQVNFNSVATVHVFNRGPVLDDREDVHAYEWAIASNSTWRSPGRTSGKLTHRRADGAFVLARKVLDEITAS